MISSKGGCIEIEFSFGSPTFMNEIVVKVSKYIIYEVKIGPGFVGWPSFHFERYQEKIFEALRNFICIPEFETPQSVLAHIKLYLIHIEFWSLDFLVEVTKISCHVYLSL